MTRFNQPTRRRSLFGGLTALALATALAGAPAPAPAAAAEISLLNASYDPTRELYRAMNRAFIASWKQKSGDTVSISMSHGGSGTQARAIIDGMNADVATLALAGDIDALAERGLVAKDWQSRLPNNATPFTSTIVLLVRKGNPKGIHDWSDLLKPGVSVITPNPKTSGGARWNFLAALGYARGLPGATDASAEDFMRQLFRQVPVLDTGARGATTSFVQRGLGDVLIAWENEAWLARREFGQDTFEIIYPSISIRAEPPVAVVDSVVDRRGTRDVATAYLQYLYTPEAQEIAAQNYYRPTDPTVFARYAERYPQVRMTDIGAFGGWTKARADNFADGGLFDRIYKPGQ